MSPRDRDAWNTVLTVLIGISAALIAIGFYYALTTEVTVNLLWPLGSTGGMTWFGYRHLVHRHQDRLRALDDAQDRLAREALTGWRGAVADVIASCRPGQRIGDAERDVFVAALHTHYAAGRLDAAELDERLSAALAAKTIEDLTHVVRDLPSEGAGR
ncbi:DUF1707 domain-containing protein [Actinomadura sp. 9N215]|uniref:DUF1707 domain-containing protein n=1 Tax=Actinomadura sp. 9N215 TaxID=3375150 RepID=UPI0037BA7E29